MERKDQHTNAATALLVMDIQGATMAMLKDGKDQLTANLHAAITAARTAGVRIIYVVVGFRKGFPEISDANKSFSAIRQNMPAAALRGLEEPAVDAAFVPQPEDIVVTKRRVSAFAGSDLEVILRAHRVEHLVLTGIATSGVVLSTLRQAADMDYRLSVLSDGCADLDPEVHNVLLNKVFPRQADVMTTEQWIAGLSQG
jgi:nicotinamidase-related amidase